MSSWGSWFGGRSRTAPRDAIVGLRENLLMLDKKEQHLHKKIEEQQNKARSLVSTNKRAATQALRQKKQYESELDRIAGTRMTLEAQVNAIESANMNLETMQAMKRGSEALKQIHGSLNIDKVDATMDSIREQMDLTNEISDAISNPVGMGQDIDEVRAMTCLLAASPLTWILYRTSSRTSLTSSSRRVWTSAWWGRIVCHKPHFPQYLRP